MSRRSVRLHGGPDAYDNEPGDFTAKVTKTGALEVAMGDTGSIDAFGRLRVSDPSTIFDSVLTYDKQPLLWNETVAGTATSVHVPNESAVRMSVSAEDDKVVRQTKQYFRYQPGKSQLILMTFVFAAAAANVRRRAGYFDAENGIFLEEENGATTVVLRSFTSGSVVETRVAQVDWNLNTFPDLDISKSQILAIDMQWLGVGRVRVGFEIRGRIVYFHEFLNSNINTTVYMSTAQLPVRLEIEGLAGITGGPHDLCALCASVMSEGGLEDHLGFPFGSNTGAPAASSGTRVPLISLRPKATFNSITNRIAALIKDVIVINNGSGTALVEVCIGVALTAPSWVSADASSTLEVDISATATTGGHLITSFYVAATNQSKSSEIRDVLGRFPLTLDITGLNPEILTVSITNTGTVTAAGAISWQEYR